jgi:hypothetical protein
LARIEPSTGKPLKAVFAARMRMMPVTTDDQDDAGREGVEDRAWASWPMTVSWT